MSAIGAKLTFPLAASTGLFRRVTSLIFVLVSLILRPSFPVIGRLPAFIPVPKIPGILKPLMPAFCEAFRDRRGRFWPSMPSGDSARAALIAYACSGGLEQHVVLEIDVSTRKY